MMGVLGGVMLGLGASMLGGQKQPSSSAGAAAHDAMGAARPAVPEAPIGVEKPDDPSVTGNAEMEAARERERQQAALRRRRAQDLFTSGLGAAGLAGTAKKTLLGG